MRSVEINDIFAPMILNGRARDKRRRTVVQRSRTIYPDINVVDKLRCYAQIGCEIALRVLRERMPNLDAVWYIDLFGEKVVKKQERTSLGVWREIETVCDDILIAYGALRARRARRDQRAT